MDLKLQIQNLKDLNINGQHFTIDCNSLSAMQALDDFAKATQNIENVNEELIRNCRKCIEAIMGEAAYNKLFGNATDTVAPYELVLHLKRIYDGEFAKDERALQEKEEAEEMAKIDRMSASIEKLSKATSLAQSKYGDANAKAFSKRAANKHRRW